VKGSMGDLIVVSRNQDVVEKSAFQPGQDRPRNDRLATKGADILPRNALAATPGWYDQNRLTHDKPYPTSQCKGSKKTSVLRI
jgi:hypothetical protein